MSLSAIELQADQVEVYKVRSGRFRRVSQVIAGTGGLLAYSESHDVALADDLDGVKSLQHADWRALYTQFQKEHVVCTAKSSMFCPVFIHFMPVSWKKSTKYRRTFVILRSWARCRTVGTRDIRRHAS